MRTGRKSAVYARLNEKASLAQQQVRGKEFEAGNFNLTLQEGCKGYHNLIIEPLNKFRPRTRKELDKAAKKEEKKLMLFTAEEDPADIGVDRIGTTGRHSISSVWMYILLGTS